ncbi:hypothetical protein PHYBLDRAFT_179451 [Phycomyces blakesleeanus NRRL 1555(-)]|uniref:Uncharacterized protein n=1 Tax=Phycomyces blakesleeanus (strain ATCC 8743b / DSM 1359 / FGSC 10004 / NBRC 33097 / NRRL 1555) TaxID=763407 RepID=A0A167PL63_PHYB8|nr:hypothetical protein PHYBLDRAFT_179451 [Phycomyces blakesleeanus NRRL 1555(-)]OAD78157.1 hypothetical protein PHYBLDRAFT_179451 [Phycomyces blakesleeanus NRRL 1555(-)]|eukprot:XP_018296197.1 hypothetical protein PHYBLDRAFT_179451 [Phycomyces blakesleeanus NRRL 1555(-)]
MACCKVNCNQHVRFVSRVLNQLKIQKIIIISKTEKEFLSLTCSRPVQPEAEVVSAWFNRESTHDSVEFFLYATDDSVYPLQEPDLHGFLTLTPEIDYDDPPVDTSSTHEPQAI